MRLLHARTLTALSAVALALWAVVSGADVIRFERALTAAPKEDAAALAPWTVTTGFRSLALEASLHAAERSPDQAAAMAALHRRQDILAQLLAVRPMASQAWITLAAVRHALLLPPGNVDQAFLMSSLTGPDESDVMGQRALLGVVIWEQSAADIRARTLVDLCGLTVYDPSRLKLVLSTKSEAVRAAIRSGLIDNGCAARMIAAIGL